MSSAIQEHVRRVAVLEACTRAGVPHDSLLARQLESEAEIGDGRNAIVRASSGVSLDERIQELSRIAKFAGDLPAAKPSVASSDMASMSAHLDDIASGRVVVK